MSGGLRARIHRGASEIGGNCVELEADGKRLVLDLGRPLSAELDEDIPLPLISGLADGNDPSLLGIVISHPHPDHYGLAQQIAPTVPVYIGEAAARILSEAAFFGAAEGLPELAGHLADRVPLELGPFRITPYLIDHSAYDSYALLVEANGRRLFYSGDLRGHGRKASTFERLIREPPAAIDVLLLEGTRLSRADSNEPQSENALEDQLATLARETAGLILALYSPQNVDRLVTIYKAARRAGRVLVLDLYAASVAAATGRDSIPQADWPNVRVYVPHSQRSRVIAAGAFPRINAIKKSRIYIPDVLSVPDQFVLTFRESMIRDLGDAGLDRARAIWSMWPGYLQRGDSSIRLLEFLERREIPITIAHCSGHATVSDLQRFAGALSPGRVVPIHTEVPARFEELFERVERHDDGEWWEV